MSHRPHAKDPQLPHAGAADALEELSLWSARQWLLGLVLPSPPTPVWNGQDELPEGLMALMARRRAA